MSAVVIDCRPVERRTPRDVAKFDATARACAQAGWQYRLRGAADALVTANLRWLAGYQHPRHHLPETVVVLRRVFATPTPLMANAEAAGDPIAVLPCCSICSGLTSSRLTYGRRYIRPHS